MTITIVCTGFFLGYGLLRQIRDFGIILLFCFAMGGTVYGFGGSDLPLVPKLAVQVFSGAAVFASLALYTRQPLIIAYIALGACFGPYGLSLVDNTQLLADIGHVGIIFLLFLLGLDMQPQALWATLRKSTVVAVFSSGLFLMTGFAVAKLFGYSTVDVNLGRCWDGVDDVGQQFEWQRRPIELAASMIGKYEGIHTGGRKFRCGRDALYTFNDQLPVPAIP